MSFVQCTKVSITYGTIKASNFEPHGNFEHFLESPAASLDELRTKNEQNRIVRRKLFIIFCFLQFSVGRVLMIANPSGKKFNFT